MQNRVLLLASYFFYGCWDYRFLSLLLISTVVDYFVSHYIYNSKPIGRRNFYLLLSLITNLGILGLFKYFNFFINELSSILLLLGFSYSFPVLHIILPVGISFYTFQTISYTIDVYKGTTSPANNFLDFALYVSFFPQLVAGPIERSSTLLPQIVRPRVYNADFLNQGLFHILNGLFRKVFIADNMAPLVNYVFSRPADTLTGGEILMGVYAFAFQIYGDFSGYSLIAKGIAKCLGFELMWNFNNPYFSSNPSEFWRRWHISLSSWLRDYLYIGLGGNRKGVTRTYVNLLLTMVLGGLWHGAGWPFLFWGVFHGALLIAYRLCDRQFSNLLKFEFVPPYITKLITVIIFFHLTCFGWLLFRAESLEQIVLMTTILFTDFTITTFTQYAFVSILFFTMPLLLFELWIEKKHNLEYLVENRGVLQTACLSSVILLMVIFVPVKKQIFIYFQF